MARIYYVDAVSGSDGNSGGSPDTALRSLAAVEHIRLKPGDQVLLARGSTFTEQLDIRYSGLDGAPITFGAYGVGADPLITGGPKGISGSKANFITIENIAISETPGSAIYAGQSTNWIIDGVTITEVAGGPDTKGIAFQRSADMTVRNSSIDGVQSDGIWADGVRGLLLENNRIGAVFGHESDGIQVINSANVVVRGNHIDMTGTDSAKGALVVNASQDVTVDGNELIGGSFGAGINSNRVVITNNDIHDQTGYNWSFGIGIGGKSSVHDYLIAGNYVHDQRFGVALTGIGENKVVRDDVEIADNVFSNNAGAAIKVDRPSSGWAHDNYVEAGSLPLKMDDANIKSGDFRADPPTIYFGADPHHSAVPKILQVQGLAAAGDITPDGDPASAGLVITSVEGHGIPKGGLALAGHFGTLTIEADGTASYALDPLKTKGIKADLFDTFDYVASNGSQSEAGVIAVSIGHPTVRTRPMAMNDDMQVDMAARSMRTGNVLYNDYDLNGDTVYLRSVETTKVGHKGETHIEGQYGDLFITELGVYRYEVDQAKVDGHHGSLMETFHYKISDGGLQDTGALHIAINLDPPAPAVDAFGLT